MACFLVSIFAKVDLDFLTHFRTSSPFHRLPSQIQILNLGSATPVTKKDSAKINKISTQHLEQANDLKGLALKILENSHYSKVKVFRYHPSKVVVFLDKHKPVLRIESDRIRLLSENGIVFGVGDHSNLPIVEGLFSDRKGKYKLKSKNELIVTADEEKRIQEVLELLALTSQRNIIIETIGFKKYRGFNAVLGSDRMEVFFGRRPFKSKIDKLLEIIERLKKRGQKARKIELDFQDKAFIKEFPFS